MRLPDEPTTPEQWQVIAWGCIVVFLLIGAVGLYYSLNAPEDKIDLARQIQYRSLAFWVMAAAVYGTKRALEFCLR